jgi:hypothetical protein
MPSAETIKQYLATTVIPVLSGAVANWVVLHLHFLAGFHIGAGSVAAAVSQVLIFGVGAGLGWLSLHHIFAGHWLPGKGK